MKAFLFALSSLAVVAAASGVQAATLSVPAGADAQERLQTALLDAKPGDVVAIGAGRFELTDGLSLDVDDVTVRGAGQGQTVLSFTGQKGAGEGLIVTSDKVTLRDFTVQDTKGDGIKAKGSDQISFIDLMVAWSGPPKESNGAYGVYPVSSTNVLIDRVTVRGASDAGIYVGQSKNIIVKRSRAEFNVAGIEIENSESADVFDNVTTRNTGGILVFDLPNLPKQGGHSHRIFRNKIVDNDTPNFAPKGNIVASVPVGTGVMVMANRNVHVFDNDISGNASTGVVVVGYSREIKDAKYEPLPRDVVVRNNRFGRNAWAPGFPGGAEIAKAVGGGPLPPIIWDGATVFTREGAKVTQVVNVDFQDGPVLKLNAPDVASAAQAKPAVLPKVAGAKIAEPAAVVLPPEQAKLAL
jgi:parallel beta-helix repeat protein